MDDHNCPYPGCLTQVPFGQLACRNHWFLLPRELRNRIWSAWRAGRTSEHADLMVQASAFYTEHASTRGAR